MSGARKHGKSTSKAETGDRRLGLTHKYFAGGERMDLKEFWQLDVVAPTFDLCSQENL